MQSLKPGDDGFTSSLGMARDDCLSVSLFVAHRLSYVSENTEGVPVFCDYCAARAARGCARILHFISEESTIPVACVLVGTIMQCYGRNLRTP